VKDWLEMSYPGLKIGQNSGDWGYESPERGMTIYDPINGYRRTSVSTASDSGSGTDETSNDTPPTPTRTTSDTDTSGNLSDYLALINRQRGILQNQYNAGYTDINSAIGRQGTAVSAKASQNIYDINSSMADAEKTGAENIKTVRTGADTARYNTKTSITNNFSARGAIDSSYFQRALDAGLGDINNQEKAQLTQITQALDKARTEATKQKNLIQMDLDIALQDLEAKRQASLRDLETQYNNGMISLAQMENEANAPISKYATTEELNQIEALANTNFEVDKYITSIDTQAQSAIDRIKASASETQQAGVDLSSVNNLLGSLSKGLKAGYRKADFVPLLVSKGYSPEQAQSILDQAELFGKQVTTNTPAPVLQTA